MTTSNEIVVGYQDGKADVLIGERRITIARRDEDTLEYLCPVDLISASLGS